MIPFVGGLLNPCKTPALPPALADHPLVREAWQDIDPAWVWDCHTHVAGTGDSGSGLTLSPQMSSWLHPVQTLRRIVYMNAACVDDRPGHVDASYVGRMAGLVGAFPRGAKLLVLAFDHFHDDSGRPLPDHSAFFVPDRYVAEMTERYPSHFEWAASIHPYRPDALEALDWAAEHGARALKWLPAAMNIDPASKRCDAIYERLAALDLPLMIHCGEENAVKGSDTHQFGNPLRLRRALDHGVRVVVAHCASLGEDVDLDAGPQGPLRQSFDLFSRVMDEPRYEKLLYADISALTQRNRCGVPLRTALERTDWHARLLNGSDYPLPGIVPMYSPARLAGGGLLPASAVDTLNAIRSHNTLLFDFVLKRHLCFQGRRFPVAVFETRRFFDKDPS